MIFREGEEVGEKEKQASICCSTRVCVHWVVPLACGVMLQIAELPGLLH